MNDFVGPMGELVARQTASAASWGAMIWATTFEGLMIAQQQAQQQQMQFAANPLAVSYDFSWSEQPVETDALSSVIALAHQLPGALKDQ